MKADNPFDLLLPAAMAKVAEEAGVYKATKHPLKTFYLAITAGVFISIAFVFYITATTGTGTMPFGMAKLVFRKRTLRWRRLPGRSADRQAAYATIRSHPDSSPARQSAHSAPAPDNGARRYFLADPPVRGSPGSQWSASYCRVPSGRWEIAHQHAKTAIAAHGDHLTFRLGCLSTQRLRHGVSHRTVVKRT